MDGFNKLLTRINILDTKSKIRSKYLIYTILLIAIILSIGVILNIARNTGSVEKIPGSSLTAVKGVTKPEEVVDKFSTSYEQTSNQVKKTGFTSWDRATLDNAYFNLIYEDKVGAYTKVYNSLTLIESAARSGVDVDENSFGINQQLRQEIKQRADENALKAAGDKK